jgi:high affinity Mn2+ porin
MIWRMVPRALVTCGLLAWPTIAVAQSFGPTQRPPGTPVPPEEAVEIPTENWAIHSQATFTTQYHPGFAAAFSGPESLDAHEQARETFDTTLYAGVRPWVGAELWVNPELDQGFGLSDTLGVAGFTSGEAYKVGAADAYPRIPRVFLRQTIDLGGETQKLDGDLNQLAGMPTANRLVLTIGKFGAPDIFDTNKYAHDPRSDFLNWSLIDTGTWDYAADAWGFTYGAAVEWYQDWWTIRSGLLDLSKIPNSKDLDTQVLDQYQWDEEFEGRYHLFGEDGAARLTGFLSHGRMGAYNKATETAIATGMPADIAAARSMHNRIGLSLNVEQAVSDDLGLFARGGWSQGTYEAFEFTDINKTGAIGLSLTGKRWGRDDDTVGLAFVMNDAASAAKRFFAAGGLGILVGDGTLILSGPEKIMETYYEFSVTSFAKLTLDYQFVDNPAYNRQRGPVSVFSARARVEF